MAHVSLISYKLICYLIASRSKDTFSTAEISLLVLNLIYHTSVLLVCAVLLRDLDEVALAHTFLDSFAVMLSGIKVFFNKPTF